MKSTYSIIFYLKREKLKKDGTYPVMGRITVDGTQCQFSCKVDCKPDLWEAKGGRATGKSVMARNVNMELDKIKARIDKYYKEIVDRDNFVTAEKVKNAFLGLEYRQHTLMTMFAQWNEEYKKMYDGGLSGTKSTRRCTMAVCDRKPRCTSTRPSISMSGSSCANTIECRIWR